MIKEYLKDNNLIIVPNTLKKKVVKEINNLERLISYKTMSLNEFLNNYFFSYDKKAIYYVMKKLKISYEIALEYLDSLYYVEDKEYKYPKLNKLVSLKNELFANKLLTINNNFSYYLKRVNIIIYGYDLDPFYLNIFNNYDYTNISIHNLKKDHKVHKFNDINDEIYFVLSDIKGKLDSGISISNIKIINSGSEYILPLKRLFSWANIPINLDIDISLYDLAIGKRIISLIEKDLSLEDIIKEISLLDSNTLNKIISIFNEYMTFNFEKEYLISMITYDLKHTYLSKNKLKNAISISSIEEIEEDYIVYLVGFNRENYPKIVKDEAFLSDIIRKELGLFTSNQINLNNKQAIRNNLYRDINYIISYKLRDSFNTFNPSLLIKEDNMEVISEHSINYSFSNFFNKMQLAILLDNYRKYGIISDDLKLLYSNYSTIPYNTYNNSFTGLDNKYFLNSLTRLDLSYTKINSYFTCSFLYYVTYILNLKSNNLDDFYMNVGNIFHYVLEHYQDKYFDFDKLWNDAKKNYQFNIGESVLLNNLKDELKFDIEVIKKQEKYTNFDNYDFEKEIVFKIDNPKLANINFSGKIDKMLSLKKDNLNLISVIDYKTGNLPKDFTNVYYGIGMQLPIYTYLIKKANLFPNSVIVGFYLQKIINKEQKLELGKDIFLQKEKDLKLFGYTNSSIDLMKEFDNTYLKSEYIRSLGVTKDNEFYKTSKILTSKQIDELSNFIETKINFATKSIVDNSFTINPKRIDGDDISCCNCLYSDICFKKESDYLDLEKKEEFFFLGGEDNA